jgi:hypothetical protein
MIAPNAGLSASRQCTKLGIARGSLHYRPRPTSAKELDLLLTRSNFDQAFCVRQLAPAGNAVARGDFCWPSAHPTADAQAGPRGGQAEAEYQQAASRAQKHPT